MCEKQSDHNPIMHTPQAMCLHKSNQDFFASPGEDGEAESQAKHKSKTMPPTAPFDALVGLHILPGLRYPP